jgi:hypothetical protein
MKRTAIVLGLMLGQGASSALAAPAPPACRDVPETESHLAVLLSGDNVLRVEPLDGKQHLADSRVLAGYGARIVLAARPSVTPDWLRQVLACHAELAAAGKSSAPLPSPLDVKGALTQVTYWPGEILIDIAAPTAVDGKEIVKRALTLRPRTAVPAS